MPGIAGIVGPWPEEELGARLHSMVRRMLHFDDYRVENVVGPGAAFASVSIAGAPAASGPAWASDGSLCALIAGEIFDLGPSAVPRDDGEGTVAEGPRSAAQLLTTMVSTEDVPTLDRLNGTFALALWAPMPKRLILCSDAFGSQPLYYARIGRGLAFCSELFPILALPGVDARLDPDGLAQLLTFEHTVGDRTLCAGVRLLKPSSRLVVHDGEPRVERVEAILFPRYHDLRGKDAWSEDLLHCLRRAMARQDCGPPGAGVLLSGGLDSRLALALLAERRAGGIPSFTFGTSGSDDARWASEVARRTGTCHTFLKLRPEELRRRAELAIRLTDGMTSWIHLHAIRLLEVAPQLPLVVFKALTANSLLGSVVGDEWWLRSPRGEVEERILQRACTAFEPRALAELAPTLASRCTGTARESLRSALSGCPSDDPVELLTYWRLAEVQGRSSVAGARLVRCVALVRNPFWDRELLDLTLQMPSWLRAGRRLMRHTFASTFHDLAKVPVTGTRQPLVDCRRALWQQITTQLRFRLREAGLRWIPVPARRPFVHYDRWLRHELHGWVADLLLGPSALSRELFDAKAVGGLLERHRNGSDHSRRLGVLITVELWLRQLHGSGESAGRAA